MDKNKQQDTEQRECQHHVLEVQSIVQQSTQRFVNENQEDEDGQGNS